MIFGFILIISWSTAICVRRSVSTIQPRNLKAGPWNCTGWRTTRWPFVGSKDTLFVLSHLWALPWERWRVPCTSARGCSRLNFWKNMQVTGEHRLPTVCGFCSYIDIREKCSIAQVLIQCLENTIVNRNGKSQISLPDAAASQLW